MTRNELFHRQGRLTVQARGMWFTAGGAKGSFGYYPHLKDEAGFPVYPDTQVKGDLLMAVRWLLQLDGQGLDPGLEQLLFGRSGDEQSALLCVTDLELTPEDRAAIGDPAGLFCVKPRIKINESTGAVQKHMLVNKEMAFLEGRSLCAELFLGPFADEPTLDRCRVLLDQAATLLSGFGAFRSRGYGRGEVSIAWESIQRVTTPETDAPVSPDLTLGRFTYCLRSETNLRNKPVTQGFSQSIETREHVAAEQVRAWFAGTYRALYGIWPTLEEMAGLRIGSLYPAGDDGRSGPVPCRPPAMTTLRREILGPGEGLWEYVDMHGRHAPGGGNEQDGVDGLGDDSGLYYGKSKALGRGAFVDDAPVPRVWETPIHARMRNSIDEQFSTLEEGGLFSQEFLPRGQVFAGTVTLDEPDSEFGRRAGFILSSVPARIKGCRLAPEIRPLAGPGEDQNPTAHLVTTPIPFQPELLGPDNALTLAAEPAYNATLRRHRRNRVVIRPGSILDREVPNRTAPWSGFGKTLNGLSSPTAPRTGATPRPKTSSTQLPKALQTLVTAGAISRSQAGFLRGLCHFRLDDDGITNILNQRLDKLQQKQDDPRYILYKAVKDEKSLDEKHLLIDQVLDALHEEWWSQKKKGKQS